MKVYLLNKTRKTKKCCAGNVIKCKYGNVEDLLNYFVKQNEQIQACLRYAIARNSQILLNLSIR